MIMSPEIQLVSLRHQAYGLNMHGRMHDVVLPPTELHCYSRGDKPKQLLVDGQMGQAQRAARV
jgi:hypothetical protein